MDNKTTSISLLKKNREVKGRGKEDTKEGKKKGVKEGGKERRKERRKEGGRK